MAKSDLEKSKKNLAKKAKSTTTDMTPEDTHDSRSYQQMLESVESIVRSIGSGTLDLDEVVTRVEEGYKLIGQMRHRLDATKAKVESLRSDFESGELSSSSSKSASSRSMTSKVKDDIEDDQTEDENLEKDNDEDDDAPF